MTKYLKPTLKTKYHINFGWWQQSGRNLRSFLIEHACAECRDMIENDPSERLMDWVDADTAEVFQIDQLWHVLHQHCGQDPDYIADYLPLTSAIFRLFIINNNTPLTPAEIHQHLHRKDPRVILRTLYGRTIYKGLSPVVLP